MFNMKRPPIPIIINLVLLTAGYLYCVYLLIVRMIEIRSDWLSGFIILLFLTFGMSVIYIEVLKRNAKFLLLLGTAFLLLAGIFVWNNGFHSHDLSLVITISLFLLTGISFIAWSIFLFRTRNLQEGTSINSRQKYNYWLYSAIVFCAAGMFFCILIRHSYENDLYGYYQFPQNIFLPIMYSLFLISIFQFSIYYILCKIKNLREKRTNCPEDGRK